MCGIFGYVGYREAEPLLLEGLRRLEYRGYDSAGLATLTGATLHQRRRKGRVAELAALLETQPAPGCVGISHTRWATHGPATDQNAHPHVAGQDLDAIAVCHNGVIENYSTLKKQLIAEGVEFRSQTDTEVIAHLIHREYDGDLVEAVRRVLPMLKGTYGLAVVCARQPEILVGVRLGSPLVVGVGDDEFFLSSDSSALAGVAKHAVYLQDGQLCVLGRGEWHLFDAARERVAFLTHPVAEAGPDAELNGFAHHMLKEIYEQPEAVENAMRGRLVEDDAYFGGLNLDARQLRAIDRIILTGCGTSWHAGLVGEYLFEELARIPVEVEYASEFRYRNPPIDRNTVVVCVTQSGETADTLAALRESKRKGHSTLAICNVVGSSIAREADGGVYLHAGTEVGVASTKAFTSQVTVLTMLALFFGRMRHLSSLQGGRMVEELHRLPDLIRQTLKCHDAVKAVAEKYYQATNMLYMGRQFLFPVALEGALKLKEISYIHAEGYPAAEMKHGPIALVDENTPSIFLTPRGSTFDKVMSNLEEVKARSGPVIAIATEGHTSEAVLSTADDVIFVPDAPEYLQPVINVVPLQLLAYHVALLRGCDVDKPRNLAKSVTVE